MASPFLTARWESLLMLNYACPPELLKPLVPAGTELDRYEGTAYVSLVGFMFLDTRVRGIPVPGHRDFEEVNLRFYVKRTAPDGELRRGVVFAKELVPRPLIALVAKQVYGEPYLKVPMSHDVQLDAANGGHLAYRWQHDGGDYALSARATGPAQPLVDGSIEEFITEHYWGYTQRDAKRTDEYRVDHPRWDVWHAQDAQFIAPAAPTLYPGFHDILAQPPDSALIAMGSEVAVYPGARLD